MQTFRLAWRSIWRNRQRTVFAVLSIGLGLALVVFFVSLKNGQYTQLVERAVRLQGGHLTLEHPGYRESLSPNLAVGGARDLRRRLDALPGVERTKAFVLGQALVRSANGAAGVLLVGVDPAAEQGSSPLPERIVAGSYLAEAAGNRVVIGSQLAEQLRVGPGKKLVISVGAGSGQIVEELAVVHGVFSMRVPEVDGFLVQVPLDFARRLQGLGADEVTQLTVVLSDPDRMETALAEVQRLVGAEAVAVRRWQQIMPDVASFIRISMTWSYLYQGFLLLLILSSIFSTLLVSVLERRGEFAVLLALGTTPRRLQLQVFAETAMIALLGCGLGLAVGGGAASAAQIRGIDLRHLLTEGMSLSGYAFDLVVRPRPTPALLLWLGGLDFAATLALGLYPMRLAARVEPSALLR